MAMGRLPGVILGLLLLRRGERGGVAGLVACATAMALSGHPETLAHTALAAAGIIAGLLAVPAAVSRRRFLARVALAAAITAGLTAPVLLPVVEALPEAMRYIMLAHHPDATQPPPFAPATLQTACDRGHQATDMFAGAPWAHLQEGPARGVSPVVSSWYTTAQHGGLEDEVLGVSPLVWHQHPHHRTSGYRSHGL